MLCRRPVVSCLAVAALSCGGSQAAEQPTAHTSAPAAQAATVVAPSQEPPPLTAAKARRVILFIWDGLRPDSVDPELTPHLAELRDKRGVNFTSHHSVYPTFTMMNAAAFATGARSGSHGFYGNSEYLPGLTGKNSKGEEVDYDQPFFSEDHALLQTVDAFYRARGSALLRIESLFDVAHAAQLKTAAIGKAGPAFLQDYRQDGSTGVVLDENVALPRSFALDLQSAGFALPANARNHPYVGGPIELKLDNGDPTAPTPHKPTTLADGATPDPRANAGSPHNTRNAYMMRVFVEHVLPKLDPALSVIWLRNPDSTQHTYGPGTPNVEDALRHQDHLLGELLGALDHLGRADSTDLLIASDHGHSSVASDPKAFPLRALQGEPDGTAKLGAVAAAGYVVSGDIRSVEWLRRAGFAHVYDGVRCVYDPVMAGVAASGQVLHETHDDPHCKTPERTSTGDYRAPHGALPSDAIVIAANGGSEYFYVPSHDLTLVQRLVSALQERRVYGPVFVRSVYGAVPGTLLLERIGMEQSASVSPPTPDVVVSFDWDDTATSAAAPKTPGREHSSPQGCRGMHGSFSPIDVHNTLIAFGPDFRPGYKDEYPSSNLDVAPTVAALFGLALPHAEGRVLTEALAQPSGGQDTYRVEAFEERVGPVPLKRTCGFDDLDCKRPQRGLSYGFSLSGHKLTSADGAQTYVYFDKGMATRAASSSSTRAQPTRSDGPK